MVRTRSAAPLDSGAPEDSAIHLRHTTTRRKAVAALTILAATCAVLTVMEEQWRRFEPEPYHTSSLTGKAWLQELLSGHRDRMKDSLKFLRPSRRISSASRVQVQRAFRGLLDDGMGGPKRRWGS